MPNFARLINLVLVAIFFFLCIKGIAKADTLKFTWKPEPDQLTYNVGRRILTVERTVYTDWGRVLSIGGVGERCIEKRSRLSVCYSAGEDTAQIFPVGYEGNGCQDTPLVVVVCPNLELVKPPEEGGAAKAEEKPKK